MQNRFLLINLLLMTSSIPNSSKNKKLHFLIVEDNQINQFVLKTILEIEHINVTIAENGQEALDKLKENHFDIILMDLMMPIMDGFEATKAIRALESEKRNTPIIAISADVTNNIDNRCIEAGMNGYTSKPIDKKILFELITKQLVSI